MNKKKLPGIGVWIVLIISVYLIYSIVVNMFASLPEMEYSDFVRNIKAENITSMNVEGNTVTVTGKDGGKAKVTIPSLETCSLT